jgi:hypothetical protein
LVGVVFAFQLSGASHADARGDLEAAAGKLKFITLWAEFYLNATPERWVIEYHDILRKQIEQKHDIKDLVELTKHKDPRVRTLAAYLLFVRHDPMQLPHLAPLVKDSAVTFPRPRPSATGRLFLKDDKLPEMDKQTVGEVVGTMMVTYMSPAGYPGFDDYWKKRKDRKYCASWFFLDLGRASRNTTPTPPDVIPAVKEVRKRIDAIPEPDRTFTLLFLRDSPGFEHLASEADLIAGCKNVGPKNLVLLLQYRIPSDDPDLQTRINNNYFYERMIKFVLDRADQLLRAEDADALVAGTRADWSLGRDFFIAAAKLNPAKTKDYFKIAWEQLEKSQASTNGDTRGDAGAKLWQATKDVSADFAAKWFYNEEPKPKQQPSARMAFLLQLSQKKPDASERTLAAAIIADKRFEFLDWQALRSLAVLVNEIEKRQVVSSNEMLRASPPFGILYHFDQERARREHPTETAAFERMLASWRQTVREAIK